MKALINTITVVDHACSAMQVLTSSSKQAAQKHVFPAVFKDALTVPTSQHAWSVMKTNPTIWMEAPALIVIQQLTTPSKMEAVSIATTLRITSSMTIMIVMPVVFSGALIVRI